MLLWPSCVEHSLPAWGSCSVGTALDWRCRVRLSAVPAVLGALFLLPPLLLKEAICLKLWFFGIDNYLPAKNLALLSPWPYWTVGSRPCYEICAEIPFLWFLWIMLRTTLQKILISTLSFTFLAGYLVQILSQREAAGIFMDLFFLCTEQHKSARAPSSSVMLQQWCEALRNIWKYLKVWPLYQQLLLFYTSNIQVYLFDVISVTVQLYKNSEFCVQ